MRMNVKQFRALVREVLNEHKLSPSLRNNKPIDNPLQNKNVAELIDRLEAAFENALSLNLVIRDFDKNYDPETREFNDDLYGSIRNSVSNGRAQASKLIKIGLKKIWDDAHESVKNE